LNKVKKVKFKRISIEKSRKSIQSIETSSKIKGITQNANNKSKTSIRLISFADIEDNNQRKQFINTNRSIKKSLRNKTLNVDNIYDEINTFR
jgi:hypothetical protein